MEKNKKGTTLNKKVFYVSLGVLVISLLFTIKSFGTKNYLDAKENGMPSFTRLSIVDDARREKASANMSVGVVLSVISGGVVYLVATNKVDLDMMMKGNKKKIKKGIAEKLKQVLEEE